VSFLFQGHRIMWSYHKHFLGTLLGCSYFPLVAAWSVESPVGGFSEYWPDFCVKGVCLWCSPCCPDLSENLIVDVSLLSSVWVRVCYLAYGGFWHLYPRSEGPLTCCPDLSVFLVIWVLPYKLIYLLSWFEIFFCDWFEGFLWGFTIHGKTVPQFSWQSSNPRGA
jgi:hypothetical protein